MNEEKEPKARLSGTLRSKRIKKLGEDMLELDIETRLVTHERENSKPLMTSSEL